MTRSLRPLAVAAAVCLFGWATPRADAQVRYGVGYYPTPPAYYPRVYYPPVSAPRPYWGYSPYWGYPYQTGYGYQWNYAYAYRPWYGGYYPSAYWGYNYGPRLSVGYWYSW